MSSDLDTLANAIKAVAAEHGAPNGVSPGELYAHYCTGLRPTRIGHLVLGSRIALNERLAPFKLEVIGYDDGPGVRMIQFGRIE